jgi:hypothetical protein
MRFFPLLLGFCVVSAFGSVSVLVNRPAKLFAEPTERSLILAEVSGKSSFRAIEQSEDKEWVFVSDALRYGWIRKSFVNAYEESLAAVTENNPPKMTREKVVSRDLSPKVQFSDDDLPTDDEADGGFGRKRFSQDFSDDGVDQDSQSGVYIVKTSGSLFEKPVRSANRFGRVEVSDQVEFLNLSNDQKWVQVRLEETGEEGWLPRKDIARKVSRYELESLNRPSDRNIHLGAYGLYDRLPWSLGFLGTLSRTFNSLMIGETPLELGVGLGYNVGSTYSSHSLAVTYIDMRGFLRWEPHIMPKVTVPFELGAVYKYGIIRTTLTQDEFNASNIPVKQNETGILFGLGLNYVPNDIFKMVIIPELQATSSSIGFVLNAGVVYSF